MDVDDEEDFYSPEPGSNNDNNGGNVDVADAGGGGDGASAVEPKAEPKAESKADLEEGEEQDESGAMDEDDDDSDIDIITERKDGTKAAPPPQSRYSDIRNIPQRSTSNDIAVKPAPAASKSPSTKAETPALASTAAVPLAVPSADQVVAAASSSKIDVNGNPMYSAVGKPITAVNIDEDLAEKEKPWRKPGTDVSDYFNYGFDEFTWALYAAKQEQVRGEFSADNVGKKMMEDFGVMMMGGMNMPGAPGGSAAPSQAQSGGQGPGGGAGPGGGMAGMDGMPPDMQAMMQQMMASGMDPSQMDPASMSAMFSGMQNQGGNAGGQGGGGGGFGENQGQYGGGFDQQPQQGMGGGGRGGGFGGHGRGGRRWQ